MLLYLHFKLKIMLFHLILLYLIIFMVYNQILLSYYYCDYMSVVYCHNCYILLSCFELFFLNLYLIYLLLLYLVVLTTSVFIMFLLLKIFHYMFTLSMLLLCLYRLHNFGLFNYLTI